MAYSEPWLTSASRTTTQTSPDYANRGCNFLDLILDVTANAGGLGSVTVTINGKDPASGKYYLLLSGAAVTTVSTNVYHIGPSLTAAANVTANAAIPEIFQVVVTANNANPMTWSCGLNLF